METLKFHNPTIEKYEILLAQNARSKVFAPLSELYRQLGLYDKAFRILKDGTRIHPSYLPGYLSLSRCYYDLEKYDSAYSAIRPFIDGYGDNLALLKLLARIYIKLHMPDEALDTYRRLLFLSPNDGEAVESIARLGSQNQGLKEGFFPIDGIDQKVRNRNIDEWLELSLGEGTTIPTKNIVMHQSSSAPVGGEIGGPIATLTLADLYRHQKYPDKAKAILRSMLPSAPASKRKEIERRLKTLENATLLRSLPLKARLLNFLRKIQEKGLEYSQKAC